VAAALAVAVVMSVAMDIYYHRHTDAAAAAATATTTTTNVVCSSNCSHDPADRQSVGRVTLFKASDLSSPLTIITGSWEFSQLGDYVTLTSYRGTDVIIASSTASGIAHTCLFCCLRTILLCLLNCKNFKPASVRFYTVSQKNGPVQFFGITLPIQASDA